MGIRIESVHGKRMANCSNVAIHGLPGLGSFTLVVRATFSVFPPKVNHYLNNIRLRVDWGDDYQRMIGVAVPNEPLPVVLTPGSGDFTLTFNLILTPTQLGAIEKERNGGDFQLNVYMFAQVSLADLMVKQGDCVVKIFTDIYTIKQQQWIEALEKMGFRRTMLFELPIPMLKDADDSKSILEKAQYHLLRGHYDECVAECRKFLEANPLIPADKEVLLVANKKKPDDRDINERMLIVRDALWKTTHLAHHYVTGQEYSRSQAYTILGAVISMMSLYFD